MSQASVRRLCATGCWVFVAAMIGILAIPCEAVDLSGSSGKFRLNIDTTLSWGARYRVQDRDTRIISPFEGGTAWSVNGDDGNLNFDKGLVSNTLKATVDFDLAVNPDSDYSFGVFLRASGFYDSVLEHDCCERTELTQEALDWAGSRVEMLDAYAWLKLPVGEIRVGRQVLNWGESTFIPGGLSVINPVDLSAIRVPGAELREAYRPLAMVWTSLDLTSNLSIEAFYEFEWEEIVVDPPGTYFSTNDFAGLGGQSVFMAFASFADTGESPAYIQPPADHPFMAIPRGPNREPEDSGQYGLALRWFVPSMGGTEFGFYYLNYHSRLPLIGGTVGTLQGAMAAGAASASAAAVIYGIYGVAPGESAEVDAIASSAGGAAAVDAFIQTGEYYVGYPEDIKLYGLSWNAQLGTSGIAFQGELSYRQDAPFQLEDVESVFCSLSPINPFLAENNQVCPGGVDFETDLPGYIRLDSSQLQFTLTKILASVLGADQMVLLGEFGFNKIFDMPDKDVLRLEAPGTYTSGQEIQYLYGAHVGKDWERPEHFPDDFSWGYRLVTRLDYNNAFGSWSLSPRFAWQHDVDGISPGPGGPFLAGRQAITVGMLAAFQNTWQVDLSYTRYQGAGRYNLINDRDFVGGFIKYSF